jgi:hypothetical protein
VQSHYQKKDSPKTLGTRLPLWHPSSDEEQRMGCDWTVQVLATRVF